MLNLAEERVILPTAMICFDELRKLARGHPG